jgi:hypothetical protein
MHSLHAQNYVTKSVFSGDSYMGVLYKAVPSLVPANEKHF